VTVVLSRITRGVVQQQAAWLNALGAQQGASPVSESSAHCSHTA
jgi:hypothetical protein